MSKLNSKHVYIFVIILFLVTPSASSQGQGDLQHISPLAQLPNVREFAKSPVNDTLVIAEADGGVYLWDAEQRNLLLTLDLDLQVSYSSGGPSLGWSPDGTFVAAQTNQGLYLWDSLTAELLYQFNEHPISPLEGLSPENIQGVTSFSFSPDNILLATAHSYDKTVLVWNIRTGEIIQQFTTEGYQNGIRRIEFSQDGRKLLVLAWETVDVWNVGTGEQEFSTEIAAETAALSSDGVFLAAGSGGFFSQIYVWDVENETLYWQFEAPLVLLEIQWALGDNLLVGRFGDFSLAHDGFYYTGMAVRTWNIEMEVSSNIFEFISDRRVPYQPSADETLIGVGVGRFENKVLIWNHITGDVYRRDATTDQNANIYPVTSSTIIRFALNSDNSMLLTGSSDGLVAVWNFYTGNLLSSNLSESAIVGVAWVLEENAIVTLSDNDNLTLWAIM